MDEDEHQIGTPAVGRVGRRLEKVSLEEPAQIIEGHNDALPSLWASIFPDSFKVCTMQAIRRHDLIQRDLDCRGGT